MNADSDSTVYVSDLPSEFSEESLSSLFSRCGVINSILMRSYNSTNLRYAFVTFEDAASAKRAFNELNFVILEGKGIFIQYTDKKYRARRLKSDGSVLVSGVDSNTTDREFLDSFSRFGELIFTRLQKGRGIGYVQYADDESALKAVSESQNVSPYKHTDITDSFTEMMIDGIDDDDFNGIKELLGEVGPIVKIEKVDRTYFIRYESHNAAKMCMDLFDGCVAGKSTLKIRISPREVNEYQYCLLEMITHLADEEKFTSVSLSNLPKTVTCGQDVRSICDEFGEVHSQRLNLNEKREPMGSAICTMKTNEGAINLIKGLKCNPRGIRASRAMTREESVLTKQSHVINISLAQRNSAKDRQFLIHDVDITNINQVKAAFPEAGNITAYGSCVLVIFRETKHIDKAISNYSGQFGDLLFFIRDENIASVPLGKSFPPQQRFPFRNRIVDRLKSNLISQGYNIPSSKFTDVTPDVARFFLSHEKVLRAWLEE